MEIGKREVGEQLPEYPEREAAGDRGRPKEVQGPIPGRDHGARGTAEGWISPPRVPGPIPPAPARARASTSIRKIIDEDRGEE